MAAFAAAVAAAAVLASAACSPGTKQTPTSAPSPVPSPAAPLTPVATPVPDVRTDISGFRHVDLMVKVTQKVVWTNRDGQVHTVTHGAPDAPGAKFDSGDLGEGRLWERVFNEPGEFPYFCRYHPDMRATITVQ